MLTPGCPVCGRAPVVEQCTPWPASLGQAPWHVGCHNWGTPYHYVGVCEWTRTGALQAWAREVEAHGEKGTN